MKKTILFILHLYTYIFCLADTPPPYISEDSPINLMSANKQFNELSKVQQDYAYYLYLASWEGSKISWFRTSFESPALFLMFQLVLNGQSLDALRNNSDVSPQEFKLFLVYVSQVFTNYGNYKSFGGTKFIPQINKTVFRKIIQSSYYYQNNITYKNIINELYENSIVDIYNYKGTFWKIGYPPENQSGYYTNNLTKDEIDFVDQYLEILNINPINTRIFKVKDVYRVLVASNNQLPGELHTFKNKTIAIHYGDFSVFLGRVIEYLEEAVKFAQNQNEINMINDYIKLFNSGNIQDHFNSMRWWIKDKSPIIDMEMGFTETYQDPKQVRGQFSGLVSLINKNYTDKVNNLVDYAERFISLLPWPRQFEKDNFIKSDFSCVDVVAFVGEETPSGINLPNDEIIKQLEGFKNFLLVNSIFQYNKTQYISQTDANFIRKYYFQGYFHLIVFHELFGHGSGKIFQTFDNGTLNYDPQTINPLTGKLVGDSSYKGNQTFNQIFQNLSNPLEECRAEAVALYYTCFEDPIITLQPDQKDNWEDIRDAAFIRKAYGAILGLEIYDDTDQQWGEAHVQGNWVIFQTLLRASDEMIVIEQTKNSTGGDWIDIKFKRELFKTIGCKAVSDLLVHLQVLRATADVDEARNYFGNLSQVDEKYQKLRKIVIDNLLPRSIILQGNIKLNENGDYQYLEYPESFEGIIQSNIDRFPDFDYEMYYEWKYQPKI